MSKCARKLEQVLFKTPIRLYCDRKNPIFKRIMRKGLEGGVSGVALQRPCRLWCKRVRLSATGGCKTCLAGTAEGEGGCGGTRRTEECETKREGERRKGGDDVRGSEVLCLRHGGRLSEAGEDAQHGSILSQETLVHPSQAVDLSQSRESLHRGGESCREGADRLSVQGRGGCVHTGRLTQEDISISSGIH